ncbi:MAG: MFS transporter [Gammaproteobacteria bacterium]
MESHITIEQSQMNWFKPWIICITAALFFFYEFVQMSMFNAINPAFIQDFSISATEIGHLSATYFYANVLFMLPAGMLLDRFSVKKIILIAMALCTAGTFLFSQTSSFHVALFCRFLTGIGGSFPFLSCLRLAYRWIPRHKMAFASGLFVTIAMTGGIMAQTPLTFLVDHLGWRHAVALDALLGVLFFALICFIVEDQPEGYSEKKPEKQQMNIFSLLKRILGNTQNWCFGIYTSCLNLPIFLLAQLWGSLYLMQTHGLTHVQSSYVTSMIFLGTIIGSPFVGWCSDMLGRRKLLMFIGAITSLAMIALIILTPHLSYFTLMVLFFGLGFFTSAQIISYPAISESNPPDIVGGALGLASVLIMTSGAFLEPLFGWLMELHWDHTVVQNIPVYSHQNYLTAFIIMPIAFLIALAMTFVTHETCCHKVGH